MSSTCYKLHCTCLSVDVSTAHILFRSLQQTCPCTCGSLEGSGGREREIGGREGGREGEGKVGRERGGRERGGKGRYTCSTLASVAIIILI